MSTKAFVLAMAMNILAVAPMWAQQSGPDATLLAQLEKKLAHSESESKRLTGGPKSLWLLREAKIKKLIQRLKAGQSVDPKEIDVALSGRIY